MQQKIRHSLEGKWDLSFTLPDEEKKVYTSAQIPGNVEPVLVEMGLIDDYMPADFEFATTKFEAVDDWCYTTTFDAKDRTKKWTQQLVFEGVDTIADIYLNDECICNCNNMHMVYRIDVTDRLKDSDNKLTVIIRSSELWARDHCHDMFAAAHADTSYYDSQTYLRKARHQWGWDNAPRVITSGIWRTVYWEELPPERFEDVNLYTEAIDDEYVRMKVDWIYKTEKKYFLNCKIRFSLWDADNCIYDDLRDVRFVQGTIKCKIPREGIQLWWPNGFGKPHLYTAKLEMIWDDIKTATWESEFGIRTLVLERSEDILDDGQGEFVFRVNGEKVFIRGTNWKPLDPLGSLADKKTKEQKALEEIKNLHCNMVRIWGGGIYEDDSFYDYCDRNGIMVWQDFMLACEVPPLDEEYACLIEQEARQIIKRYRNHASLAVWCGDNENDESMVWVRGYSNLRPSDSIVTRKILKKAVLCMDPYRSYVDSSPYVSDINFSQRRGEKTFHKPEEHLYPKVTAFSESLRQCKSFFIGETGPIGVNAITVNQNMFEREKSRTERLWDSPQLRSTTVHQNDGYFTAWRRAGKEACVAWYGRDFRFDEWKDYTLAINIICAEVFKDVIEYSRVMRWSKTGVIWWSLIDMWPMLFNYSVIDSEYKRKLPYYWIRQSQQEVAICAVRVEQDGDLVLYVVNDTLQTHIVEYSVTAYDEAGDARVIATGNCVQGANSSTAIQKIGEKDCAELLFIRWKYDGRECANHVFTKKAPFDVMKKWTRIIGEQSGFAGEIHELV